MMMFVGDTELGLGVWILLRWWWWTELGLYGGDYSSIDSKFQCEALVNLEKEH